MTAERGEASTSRGFDRLRDPIAHWMTRGVLTVHINQTIEDAIAFLGKQRIHGAPVVDELGELCGVISGRDILAAGSEQEEPPSYYYDGYIPVSRHPFEKVLTGKVHEFMSDKVLSVRETDTVASCVAMMVNESIHRVLITNEKGRLLGIASALDLLKLVHLAEGERASA